MTWDYAFFEYCLAAAVLVLSMLGMGTTLTVREFLRVARAPRGVLLAIGTQVLLSPLLALFLGWAFDVPRGIAIGMLVVSALPGGAYTNMLTYFGKGNIALSISATAVCTAACVVTAPLVLGVFGYELVPRTVVIPVGRVFFEIAAWLLAPLISGMAIRHWDPRRCVPIGKVCIRASLVLLFVLIVASIAMSRLRFGIYGWRTPIVLILLSFSWLWLTYALAWLLRLNLSDKFTIAVEVVVRNANLGLLLKASLFPPNDEAGAATSDGVLYAVLFSAAVGLSVATAEVFAHRLGVGPIYGRRSTNPKI